MKPNLQSIAAAWGVGNEVVIADLIKNAPMLQTATVRRATHGTKHRYRFTENIPEAVFREVGQGIVPQRIDQNRAAIDLKELVFKLYDDYRIIDEWTGGKEGFLRDNYQVAYEGLAQGISKAVFYGNLTEGSAGSFKGLLQYAADFNTIVSQKAGTSGARSSIIGVRWDEHAGASLRVNNNGLLDIRDLTPSGTSTIVTDTTTNTQMEVYQWLFASYFALVATSKSSVAAITQIASDKDVTVDDMNKLVNVISRVAGGNRAIYTTEMGLMKISKLKSDKLSMFMETMNVDTYVASWRGVPIYVDGNLLETETI